MWKLFGSEHLLTRRQPVEHLLTRRQPVEHLLTRRQPVEHLLTRRQPVLIRDHQLVPGNLLGHSTSMHCLVSNRVSSSQDTPSYRAGEHVLERFCSPGPHHTEHDDQSIQEDKTPSTKSNGNRNKSKRT